MKVGIISEELADVFYPPDEPIPAGCKRPLRIRSKARVMTAIEIYADISEQMNQITEQQLRASQRASNNSRGAASSRGRGKRRERARRTVVTRVQDDNFFYIGM